jgi:hypothetical protein
MVLPTAVVTKSFSLRMAILTGFVDGGVHRLVLLR